MVRSEKEAYVEESKWHNDGLGVSEWVMDVPLENF